MGALGAGAVAGCVTGGRLRRYRVRNDAAPDGLPATVSAEAVATPTRERPLLLRITFESTADEPTTFAIEPPGAFPFGRTTAANLAPTPTPPADVERTVRRGPRQLVLAVPGAGGPVERCWTATGAADSSADSTGSRRVRLAPGESVSAERAVLNDEANVTCYPIGVYRFAETFRFGPAPSAAGGPSPVPWSFALEISDLRPGE